MPGRLSAGPRTAVRRRAVGGPWVGSPAPVLTAGAGRLREVSDSRDSNEEPRQRGCLAWASSAAVPQRAWTGPFAALGVYWKAGAAGLPLPVSGRQPGDQKTAAAAPLGSLRRLCQCRWSGGGWAPPGRVPGVRAPPCAEPARGQRRPCAGGRPRAAQSLLTQIRGLAPDRHTDTGNGGR